MSLLTEKKKVNLKSETKLTLLPTLTRSSAYPSGVILKRHPMKDYHLASIRLSAKKEKAVFFFKLEKVGSMAQENDPILDDTALKFALLERCPSQTKYFLSLRLLRNWDVRCISAKIGR